MFGEVCVGATSRKSALIKLGAFLIDFKNEFFWNKQEQY
jgi:hypothetical protein